LTVQPRDGGGCRNKSERGGKVSICDRQHPITIAAI
jgi:hypothetical protein